jgi:hypothetical protein
LAAPNFSDDELVELLDLIKGADSVELRLTVPESDHRSAVSALGMDPLDAEIRQVYFFDTPNLAMESSFSGTAQLTRPLAVQAFRC